VLEAGDGVIGREGGGDGGGGEGVVVVGVGVVVVGGGRRASAPGRGEVSEARTMEKLVGWGGWDVRIGRQPFL
jgi:hypothetical protein